MEFKLEGKKTLVLESQEVAIVLDALAVQPYNRVAGLIPKIMSQCVSMPKETEKDAQPES